MGRRDPKYYNKISAQKKLLNRKEHALSASKHANKEVKICSSCIYILGLKSLIHVST
jgi:hypothetical protein